MSIKNFSSLVLFLSLAFLLIGVGDSHDWSNLGTPAFGEDGEDSSSAENPGDDSTESDEGSGEGTGTGTGDESGTGSGSGSGSGQQQEVEKKVTEAVDKSLENVKLGNADGTGSTQEGANPENPGTEGNTSAAEVSEGDTSTGTGESTGTGLGIGMGILTGTGERTIKVGDTTLTGNLGQLEDGKVGGTLTGPKGGKVDVAVETGADVNPGMTTPKLDVSLGPKIQDGLNQEGYLKSWQQGRAQAQGCGSGGDIELPKNVTDMLHVVRDQNAAAGGKYNGAITVELDESRLKNTLTTGGLDGYASVPLTRFGKNHPRFAERHQNLRTNLVYKHGYGDASAGADEAIRQIKQKVSTESGGVVVIQNKRGVQSGTTITGNGPGFKGTATVTPPPQSSTNKCK